MLLVLSVVYLFHGFQTRAAPLTSLLTESSSNATVSSTSASISPVVQRSIWDILWSRLASIFLVHGFLSIPTPDIPGPSNWPRIGNSLPFRQWSNGRRRRRLEKLFRMGRKMESNTTHCLR